MIILAAEDHTTLGLVTEFAGGRSVLGWRWKNFGAYVALSVSFAPGLLLTANVMYPDLRSFNPNVKFRSLWAGVNIFGLSLSLEANTVSGPVAAQAPPAGGGAPAAPDSTVSGDFE